MPNPQPPDSSGVSPTQTAGTADFLSTPAEADEPRLDHFIGRRVGPYRIERLLGRGGMGAVFLASRDDAEFKKNVALKLLRFETDQPAVFDEDLGRNPNDRLLRSRRARALRHLGYALLRNKRLPEARQATEQAAAIQRQLLAETPSDASEREQLELTERAVSAVSKF